MSEPIRWSEGGQIEYIDGRAFGSSERAGIVCLGDADKIKKLLTEGGLTGKPVIDEILEFDRQCLESAPQMPPQAPRYKKRRVKR